MTAVRHALGATFGRWNLLTGQTGTTNTVHVAGIALRLVDAPLATEIGLVGVLHRGGLSRHEEGTKLLSHVGLSIKKDDHLTNQVLAPPQL